MRANGKAVPGMLLARRKKRANADRRIRLTYGEGVEPLLGDPQRAKGNGRFDSTPDGNLPGAIRKKRASTMKGHRGRSFSRQALGNETPGVPLFRTNRVCGHESQA